MPSFRSRAARVWIVGCAGVLALLLQAPPADLLARVQSATGLSPFAVRIASLVNPLVLTTLMALVGAAVAHRVGLHSAIAGTRPVGAPSQRFGAAAALGLLAAACLVAGDAAFAPALGDAWREFDAAARRAAGIEALLLGILYGGLAEEVMSRWGLMSLVAFALAKLAGVARDGTPVTGYVAWPAIVVTALAFAAGHLPALAQSIDLSPAIVVRTLVLNAVVSILYGWLYWRRGLEAAMVSHAATHVGLALARVASRALAGA